MNKSKIKTHLEGVVFIDLETYEDDRGWLMELFRSDCLLENNFPEMGYISQTKPGVTRGPHEHSSQSDLFCFVGPGNFELTLSEQNLTYEEKHIVGENNPVAVIVPPKIIHSYTNISKYPGLVLNFPNRLFAGPGKLYPIDEIRHEDF